MDAAGESWHFVPEPGSKDNRADRAKFPRGLRTTFVTPEGCCSVSAWFSTWRIGLPHRVPVPTGLFACQHGL